MNEYLNVCSVNFIHSALVFFFFVSSGMDSNSQTSQELLIPNDVRPSNSKVRFFFSPPHPLSLRCLYSPVGTTKLNKKKII